MQIDGYIKSNSTYAEVARVEFKKDKEGTDVIMIEDGVLYLYKDCSLVRIAKVFDIEFTK